MKDQKDESGFSYNDICSAGGITRKQLSIILKGDHGVSIEKIEEVLLHVFGVKVGLIVGEITSNFDDFPE
tara:strand:+ start:13626 stop:13835 length:210 start_codon:yes stop_codon:yes gene_type:complete